MSATVRPPQDEVAIQVGDKRFHGWQTLAITRSCEQMPNSFILSASAEFLQGAALAGTQSGRACSIYIGGELVITGWIDRRSIVIDAHTHSVTLTGRGITRNLVDCSADILNDPGLKGGLIDGANTLDVAKKLAKAYGVTVRSAVADLGPPIRTLQANLGQTPYEIIESVAGYARFLVYEDENGVLVLDRVSKQKMASGFTLPGNIEAISAEHSEDQRYSLYCVVMNSVAQLTEISDTRNLRWAEPDKTLGEYRLKISVSAQNVPDLDFGEAYAKWEKARRIGRSQAAQITCDSWRDSSGMLWTPNRLATLDAPDADISHAEWIIGTVTYRKDLSGTHADLVLMPPDAFDPEPNPQNLWNAELHGAERTPELGAAGHPGSASSPATGAAGAAS